MYAQPSWQPWTISHVVDAADFPAFALRTYIEQADVRAYLQRITTDSAIQFACEIGCGYGRMIVVLGEFAKEVVGFERQPEFVAVARRLYPRITFHQVQRLGQLPVPDESFDLVFSFTFLQHLTDNSLGPALAEIKRVLRPGGFVLLCEDTNAATPFGDVTDEHGICVVGRSVEAYANLLFPLRFLASSRRRVEPTCPHKDVGHYMLFQR